MLVRCWGKSEANEAIRALMRIRMRLAGLADHNYHWSNPHPGNSRTSMDQVQQWLAVQWKHAAKLDRNAIVPPDQYEVFDKKCRYQLWYIPDYPTSEIEGRVLPGNELRSHEKWVERLWDSIQKHGFKDPIFGYTHDIPGQIVGGSWGKVARIVLGNNRVALAQKHGIKTIPAVLTVNAGSWPKFGSGRPITPEEYHNDIMHHRADCWATYDDFVLVHPPTVFYDEKDGGNLKPCPL